MARGSVVKRASGNWAIVYPARGRKVWETLGASKREAERLLERRMAEVRDGTWEHPRDRCRLEPQLTLAAYAEQWLERQNPERIAAPADGRFARRRIARSTFETYRGDLHRHVLPALGETPLVALTTRDVDGLIATLEAKGKAPQTIRNAIVPLRKMLGEAMRQGVLDSNPASRCDLPPPQDFAGKEIPPEHCRAIRAALRELAAPDPFRDGDPDLLNVYLFDVALGTGLRFGELRALQWQDVDREHRLVRVQRAYSGRELTRPKSAAGIRSVPLFASVEAALTALSARALDRGRYAPGELIFPTVHGTAIHGTNFTRRVWRKALERAELEDEGYRLHDCRHTCVSRLVAAGADVALVQAVAGHSDPRLTLGRYTHLRDTRVSEAATRFDPAGLVAER